MIDVGDTVITMGAPGRFAVVAVDGAQVTIESAEGVRKVVLDGNLRKVGASRDRVTPERMS